MKSIGWIFAFLFLTASSAFAEPEVQASGIGIQPLMGLGGRITATRGSGEDPETYYAYFSRVNIKRRVAALNRGADNQLVVRRIPLLRNYKVNSVQHVRMHSIGRTAFLKRFIS